MTKVGGKRFSWFYVLSCKHDINDFIKGIGFMLWMLHASVSKVVSVRVCVGV